MNKIKAAAVLSFSVILASSAALPVLAEEASSAGSDWTRKAVSNQAGFVNIRSDAGMDSDCVGVLLPGGVVEVKGRKNEWTRIHSGKVDGFIRSDLISCGEEAREIYENQEGNGLGTVDADILFVRSGASLSDEILGTMQSGDVIELVAHHDGWYEISYDGMPAFVSEEFVAQGQAVETALTLDEYESLVGSGAVPEKGTTEGTPDMAFVQELIAQYLPSYDSGIISDIYDAGTVSDTYDAGLAYDAYDAGPAYDTGLAYDAYDTGYTETVPETVYQETEAYTDAYDAGDLTGQYGLDSYDYSYEETPAAETADTGYQASYNVGSGDLDLLAAIIQCEAGGESREGKVAVGACVLNRVNSGSFPDTISDVIYESGQFTPAMTGNLDQVLAEGATDACYEAAQAALSGENPIGDLLFFHAGGGSGLTIGNQTFY